jgi:Protein of unknown function (DUF2800)
MSLPNAPTAKELTHSIIALCDMLKALDASAIDSADLVPMVKAVQSIGAYQAAIDAQIAARAIGNNELIPGVVVKDAVVHRRWSDQEAAEQLAQEQFGDDAFTRALKSPAQIEKLKGGEGFVAVASYKPEAGKKVVY